MPVTAKLSKKFYDRFGDEIANELVDWFNQVDATYRSNLFELNEVNFARFEAKLEQRLAELEARVDQKMTRLEARIDRKLVELEARIDRKLVELEARIDRKLADLEARIDGKISDLRVEMHTEITRAKDSLLRWMIGLWITQMLAFAGIWLAHR